jgi:hypothetical protein
MANMIGDYLVQWKPKWIGKKVNLYAHSDYDFSESLFCESTSGMGFSDLRFRCDKALACMFFFVGITRSVASAIFRLILLYLYVQVNTYQSN